mgnify:CR=1 FL=1
MNLIWWREDSKNHAEKAFSFEESTIYQNQRYWHVTWKLIVQWTHAYRGIFAHFHERRTLLKFSTNSRKQSFPYVCHLTRTCAYLHVEKVSRFPVNFSSCISLFQRENSVSLFLFLSLCRFLPLSRIPLHRRARRRGSTKRRNGERREKASAVRVSGWHTAVTPP